MYRRTEMKQVKFHRTELSLSVSGAEFCALSEHEGLSLQKLQERQFVLKHRSEKRLCTVEPACNMSDFIVQLSR